MTTHKASDAGGEKEQGMKRCKYCKRTIECTTGYWKDTNFETYCDKRTDKEVGFHEPEPTEQVTLGDGEPKRFTKKPVTIEAVQWTGQNLNEVMAFCSGNATYELMHKGNSELIISTLEDGSESEAVHVASKGDWIIKGVKGEFYPCKPDIFAATYDRATPPTAGQGERDDVIDLDKQMGNMGKQGERGVLPPLDITESELYTAYMNPQLNNAGKSAYMDLLCRQRQLLSVQAERDAALEEARKLREQVERLEKQLDEAGTVLGRVCVFGTLARGERPIFKEIEHAAVCAVLEQVQRAIRAEEELDRQYEFNAGQIVKVAALETELAQLKAGKGDAQ